MSLVDPNARDRDPAVAARRRAVWMTVMLLAATAAGYGASIFGDFPGRSYGFGGADHGALIKVLLLLAGCIGAIVALGVVVRLPRPRGAGGRPAFVVGLAVLAVAAGQFAGSLLPTAIPEFAGTDLSAARTGLRIQSGVVVLVALVLLAWAVREQRGRDRRAGLRATGHHTSGVVTDVHDTGGTVNNAPRIRLTVRFTDTDGHERFVRRRLTVSRLSIPSRGDQVPVWFDPRDPGDERKIVLGSDT